jgi:hypothetical protein
VPKAKKNLGGSGINEVNDRDSGVALLGEMLMLCNEAARRFKHDAAPGTGSKPLALEYLADRMDTDDPLHGWVVRTRKEGWMQGFCTITNFTTWVRWFRWDSLAPQAGVFPSGDSSEEEEEVEWLSRRVVDRDNSLAAALNEQVHDGDPDGEGVIWPHLAEISLLGALGCGSFLLRLILEELEKPDSQYDYCVCQATDNAVPFYESLGFVRVGAVARYDYAPKTCGDAAEAQEHLRRQVESRQMLKIWDAIATARDEETGELHSTLFMSLPSKNVYPDYYELVKNPIALNPIRKKIEAHKYESMEEFEMDLKLLIDNARVYNSPESLVYSDAESMQQVAFDKLGKQYFGNEPGAQELLWMQFKVGFQLDVKDSRGHWYKATIREMGVDRIKVHYHGWNEKWNEWHKKGNDDVQPLGTHTGGGQTTKRKLSAGMQYKVLKAADVREGFPLSSKISHALRAGEVVTAVEKRSNDRGQVRVRIEKPCSGWASITSRDGATLLAPADPNSSIDSFVNETAAANAASKSGWVDPEKQGHIGISSKTFWYQVKDGQTPRELASKHHCRAWDIVWMNKHLYPGLDTSSKMKEGTKLRIPVVKSAAETKKAAKAAAAKASAAEARPSVYEASNDETPKMIANKLGIDVVDLVSANRSRYEGMTQTSRLMAGTKLKIPRGDGHDDDDDYWAGGAGVVSYRHWTFPNDPVELTYPSYMMARKLNKRKVDAPPGSILAQLDKYVHDPPQLATPDEETSDSDQAGEMDLAALDAALTKEDAKRGMVQVLNAVVSCTDEEDQLAQHRVRSVFFRELPSRTMFPDYYKVIKQPLCLNQVRSRMNGGKYDSPSAFMADLKTVFGNARQYNDPLAQIYHDAQIMECVAEEEMQAWQDDWRYRQAQAHYEAQLPPKPKRPASSYLCYANSERESVSADLGDSNNVTAVAKELGVRWNAMTRRERRRYEDEAERDTTRYERELGEYNRQIRGIPKPQPKPRRQKKQRPPRPVAGGPLPTSPRGARSSPVTGRPSNQGPTNFFNKVVTVKGESLVGDYDYFFVLTYIPDLQWCRLAPLVQDGVFGRDRGARKGWPRWVLARDEGSEMDVSAARCKACRAKAVNRSADADAEEWEIREGEAERVLGMKRENNGGKKQSQSTRKGSGRGSTRGESHDDHIRGCPALLVSVCQTIVSSACYTYILHHRTISDGCCTTGGASAASGTSSANSRTKRSAAPSAVSATR